MYLVGSSSCLVCISAQQKQQCFIIKLQASAALTLLSLTHKSILCYSARQWRLSKALIIAQFWQSFRMNLEILSLSVSVCLCFDDFHFRVSIRLCFCVTLSVIYGLDSTNFCTVGLMVKVDKNLDPF